MPGLSRLSIIIVVWRLWRSHLRDWAFLAGLSTRLLPVINFYIVSAIHTVLQRCASLYRRFVVARPPLLPPTGAARFDAADCPICFEPLNALNSYALEDCGHAYHEACLEQWARTSATCPVCKADISLALSAEDWIRDLFSFTWATWYDRMVLE